MIADAPCEKRLSPTQARAVRVLMLGGGAVARECLAPALESLGVLDGSVIVDWNALPEHYPTGVRVVAADFGAFLASASVREFSHCIIALPNALHVEAVTTALQAGLHVLCEKPLALRRQECEALARKAEQTERLLAVNMVRRRFHSIKLAREVIAAGWLGTVRLIRVAHGGAYSWPVSSLAPFEPRNGGVLADMGVHYLDLVEWLAGPLSPTSYRDDFAGGVESECQFELRSERGVSVEIALSRLHPLDNEIVIDGTLGRLRLGVDTFDRVAFESTTAGRVIAEPLVLTTGAAAGWTFADYFAEQVRRFLLPGFEGDPGFVDARAAGRSAALIEWAYGTRGSVIRATSTEGVPRLHAGAVLITGATGFIGSHLVDRLSGDATGRVTASYRSAGSCAAISRFPVTFHRMELQSPEDLREAVRGCRYVFHLAYGQEEGLERTVTVEGTKRLIEACITEGVEAVVVLSTMYVLGRPGGIVDESAPYRPIGGMYGATKAEMERWCLDRAKTSGATRIVVLLPTCVYGPRGGAYTELPVTFARDGRFCWVEDGRGIANVLYVENLVDAMVRAATASEAHGQRFIISDDAVTWREFLSPLLGPWLDRVTALGIDELREMTSRQPGPGARDVAAAILRSPDVWSVLGRTRAVNAIRPFAKKYAPWVSRWRYRSRHVKTLPQVPTPVPPPWLADVFSPDTTTFSAVRAHEILRWTPRIQSDVACSRTVEWLRRQRLYTGASKSQVL